MRQEIEFFAKNMDSIITFKTARKGEWRNYDTKYFKEKLTEEYAEVIEAFKRYKKGECNKDIVMGEITDLANICMMLFTLFDEKENG